MGGECRVVLKLRRLEEEVNLPNLVGKLMRPVDRVGCRKGLFFFCQDGSSDKLSVCANHALE